MQRETRGESVQAYQLTRCNTASSVEVLLLRLEKDWTAAERTGPGCVQNDLPWQLFNDLNIEC